MNREALLELIEVLGKEFERRAMRVHVESLRLYYLAVRHQLDRGHDRNVRLSWGEAHTVEWLALLRIPPYQNVYRVRPRGYRCDCVLSATVTEPANSGDTSHLGSGTAITEATFPGGWKIACKGCGAKWIEEEGDGQLEPISGGGSPVAR
jgi:hypothetical protein